MNGGPTANDRIARAVLEFIHSHARDVGDEIARTEAAIDAIPAIAFASKDRAETAEDSPMLRQLQGHVKKLRDAFPSQ